MRTHERRRAGSTGPDLERLYRELEPHRVELDAQSEELRAAQAQVEAAHRRYADLYDSAPIALLSLAPDGTIAEANLATAALLGVPRSRLRGARLQDFLPPGATRDLGRAMRTLGPGRDGNGGDISLLLPGGVVRVMHVTGSLPADSAIWRVAMEDVTGQRELETLSREEAAVAATRTTAAELATLALAIEETSESVVVTDANATITYVNAAFLRVTGYTRDEVLGRNPRILKSGVHPPDFYAAMWVELNAGRPWHSDMVNARKDGTRFTEEVSISPVRDHSGSTTGYVAVKRDVTMEREREAQQLQSQRLEAVGHLAGGVAHDFNNLLAVITGYAELVQGALPPGSGASEDIAQVIDAANRATALTRRLLDFGRRSGFEPRILDAGEVIDGLVPLLRVLLGEPVEMTVTHGPERAWVLADADQLGQVVINLAVNARDAMPAGGRLAIATAIMPAEPEAASRDGDLAAAPFVRITVADSGTGMDEATAARAFEPFFTTKAPGKGTGLGLSTCYGMVRQAGGRISVVTAPGAGSTFSVDLRLGAPAPAIDAGEAPTTLGSGETVGGGETILLVEDEPALRMLVARMLVRLGYHVHQAASADEAITIAATPTTIDVLLSDVRMPGMQGPELATLLVADRPALRVVLMTGHTDGLGTPIDRHVSGVLSKPFDVDTLGKVVADALAPAESGRDRTVVEMGES